MDFTNDLKSIRSWLNALYPDASILVERNSSAVPKSYFFLNQQVEAFEDRGYGWYDILRTIQIHLITEGNSQAIVGKDTFWKAQGVMDFLRNKVLTDRIIPSYLFNYAWSPPRVSVRSAAPPGAPLGDHYLKLSSVCANGIETMPSPATLFTLNYPEKALWVACQSWPLGRPLTDVFRLYHSFTPAGPYQLIQEIARTTLNQYMTETALTNFTPLSPTTVPVEKCKVPFGALKVQDAQMAMIENSVMDNSFHGILTMKVRSRNPRWMPMADASFGTITTSITTP